MNRDRARSVTGWASLVPTRNGEAPLLAAQLLRLGLKMRSDIKNVTYICKPGAYGNPVGYGFWAYGKRPDGRTVPCKFREHADGSVTVSSGSWASDFTKDEWSRISTAHKYLKSIECNNILRARKQSSSVEQGIAE